MNTIDEDIRYQLEHELKRKLRYTPDFFLNEDDKSIANIVMPIIMNWVDTARRHAGNEEYYRGLLIKIGNMLGPDAYVSDDGSKQQDVLCAKIPEMVKSLLKDYYALQNVNYEKIVEEEVGGVKWVEDYNAWKNKL